MLIKRVVIHGFKTFARRTEFVFDPGVTAVVGPNGSGKSNVVDAIRWCLGEQSFTLLRSKKTSDVIFAGSDKKARLGMAEVSLTLDNSGGEIPIDFAEVEITRRAYRDGDNEYLVNGQRVRLLDVVELLAQTGLGKRTYSVVGQGLIDRALSMAPEERRSLFEEAAGITGYQIKRTTAMRRLEATSLNLTRVQDIVAELSPRLGYLKRQADRARERERLVNDLQALLRDWYGYRWHAVLRQVQEQHGAEQTLKAAAQARQTVLAAATAQIEGLRARQLGLRAHLADRHGESSILHRQAETVGRELAVHQERLRQLQARQEDAQRELAPLHVQRETLAARQEALRQAVTAAEAVHRARLQAVADLQAEVGQRQQERTQVQERLTTARRALNQAQDQRAANAARSVQLNERRAVLLIEQEQHRVALAAAGQDATAAALELHAAEAQTAQLEEQAVRGRQSITEHEARLAALRGEQRQAEEARQAADRQVDRLQTRFDMLNRLRSDGAGYGSGVRSVIQAGRKGGALTGILGTVASLLRVPPELEKAIETALGGALQNVITTRWADATTAIDYLKRERGGRATFLPLDRLQVLPRIAAPRRAGLLGNAVDLVAFDADVADAMEQLLNRVWIAETLAAARAALDSHSGSRPTVVTLDGEIVRPGGAVTGGSEGGRGDDSLLARERELRELPATVATATQAASQAAAAYARLAKQSEEGRGQLERAQAALAELARTDRQQRQRVEELRRRVDRARQAERWQQERLGQASQELEQLAARAVADQAAGAQEPTVDQAAAAVAQLEQELAAISADTLLQTLADRRTEAAEAQGQLRSQTALLENTGRSLQDAAAQSARKDQQIAQLETELAMLAQRVALLAGEESDLSRQLEALQAVITPVESALGELEALLVQAEGEERRLQQLLRKEENAWNAAQLQLQRSEDLLQQLRGEIEQDLGLVRLEQIDDVAYQPPLPWDAFVQQLPVVESVPETLEEEVRELRARVARLGSVNPEAPKEYDETAERHTFLKTQAEDLAAATAGLQKIIGELDARMEVELLRTYAAVGKEFTYFFQQLFNGGTAHLELTDPEHITTSGVEIIARPPGKRPQSLALLSGGERSLSACALIFAILRVSPTPFCVLDEVDAALDEANIDRFRTTLGELSHETQFIVVTHNRRTLEGANTIYGVTMGNDGISQVMSLRLEGDRILHRDVDTPSELNELVPL